MKILAHYPLKNVFIKGKKTFIVFTLSLGMVFRYECVCAQSCPTLSNPMDCSLPGSSVHGIFQTRILEWVAMPFSRGSS